MRGGPIFVQIAESIRRRLARGELAPGDRIPSARDLAVELGVNPNTVAHAFALLEDMNVIEIRRGRGAFVHSSAPISATRQEMLRAAAAAFAAEIRALRISSDEAVDVLKEILDATG